jgi:hypothetical protein
MRAALSSDAARDDPERHLLSQRLGLLEEPDAQTIEFAQARFAESAAGSDVDAHHSAAYTLGAVAAHAGAATRAELHGMLASALERSSEPAAVAHFINALANARDASDSARFAAYAAHPDGDVRRAAAAALRRPSSDEGRTALLRLAADSDRGVQKQAVRSLRDQALTGGEIDALRKLVARGELHRDNVRPMLELTKGLRREHPKQTDALIEALIGAGIQDNQALAAARRLLRGPPPP